MRAHFFVKKANDAMPIINWKDAISLSIAEWIQKFVILKTRSEIIQNVLYEFGYKI